MKKRFYKIYKYVAEIFYPDIIETIVSDIAFLIGDEYCDNENKLCKIFLLGVYNFYWLICGSLEIVIEKILYLIGKTFYPETGEYKDYDYSDPSNFA